MLNNSISFGKGSILRFYLIVCLCSPEEPRRTSSAQRPSSGWTKEELPRESTGELIAKGNFDDLLVDSSFDGDEF